MLSHREWPSWKLVLPVVKLESRAFEPRLTDAVEVECCHLRDGKDYSCLASVI